MLTDVTITAEDGRGARTSTLESLSNQAIQELITQMTALHGREIVLSKSVFG